MKQAQQGRSLVKWLAMTTGAGLLFVAGAAAGYMYALRPFRSAIGATDRIESLGAAFELSALSVEDAALAYEDPKRARRELRGYAYTPPVAPTPFVGHMLRPGKSFTSTANAAQMRASSELVMPKPPGVFRIFLTGGSVAFGSGAPDNSSTIGGFLEQALNEAQPLGAATRIEVLTAACPGWTSTHERILIENRLCDLEPDLVVEFSGNNDVHFANQKTNVLWMRGYGDWVFWEVARLAWRRVGRGDLFDVLGDEHERPTPETVGERLTRNVRLASCALEAIDGHAVPLVFVLQPTLATSGKQLSAREARILDNARTGKLAHLAGDGVEYFQKCYAVIRARLGAPSSTQLHFVDASTMFDSTEASVELFLDSFHFGDRGNRRIAEFLAREIGTLLSR